MVKGLGQASISGLPTQPGACPTYTSARGPMDEGELLGCQQDPVGAPHKLQLLDAKSGGQRKCRVDGWYTCHFQFDPAPWTCTAEEPSPQQPQLGWEGTAEHFLLKRPSAPAQGSPPGLVCLLVPSSQVPNCLEAFWGEQSLG